MDLSAYIGVQPKTKEILNAIDSGIEAIAEDLNTILNDLVALKGYTDTLEAGQTTIQGYTDTLESAISTIQGYVDTLESGQTSLDTLLDECLTYLDRIEDHNHNIQYVYPTLADAPQLTSGSGTKWTLGSFVELIPENAIAYPFDIHYFNTGIGSLVGTYEVHLFSGTLGNEVLFAKLRFARLSNQTGASPFPIMTPVFPANTRISGKLAVNVTTQETLLCSLAYHHY